MTTKFTSQFERSLVGVKARKWAGRRGAAAVEFAIVAPLMFMLIFGIVEIGRAIMVQQIATNASREAARAASLHTANTTVTSVREGCLDYLQTAGVSRDACTVDINIGNADGTPGPAVATDFGNVNIGDPIMVSVTVNFAQVTWLPTNVLMRILPNNAQFLSRAVMRSES